MSGVAFTIRSPSSSRMSLSVVWVAGCCGPKFSVQVACLDSVTAPGGSSKSVVMQVSLILNSVPLMIRPERAVENCAARLALAGGSLSVAEKR